jgi:UDP-N-acetylglucosamine 4,6-dehydratase
VYTLGVTGGTGSLGKAILNQQDLLKANHISRVRIISRDEIKQDDLEKNYKGEIDIQCVLGDVRDAARMEMALDGCEYLIHAAALKIAPKIEYDVAEAIRTNICGTENVLKAFLKNKCSLSGIFVSTDKAVDPLNAYGFTKATAERLWLWGMMFQNDVKLSVCRYGNVFGSRGSVIYAWNRALAKGDPLKITSPAMTRFFIRLDEAAQFVLTRLFKNTGAQICIPKMKSTRMIDLGEVMSMEDAKVQADWEMIGLREGEKIHEVLTSVNDDIVFSSKDHYAIHPLTEHTACYKEADFDSCGRIGRISSESATPLTAEELRDYYREWKNAHSRS